MISRDVIARGVFKLGGRSEE